MSSATFVQKLWNYCKGPGLRRDLARSLARKHAGARVDPRLTLRDDGMSCGCQPEARTGAAPNSSCKAFSGRPKL